MSADLLAPKLVRDGPDRITIIQLVLLTAWPRFTAFAVFRCPRLFFPSLNL